MSVFIEISVTQDTATAKLAELGRITGDPATLLMMSAKKIKDFVQLYHEGFDGAWRGSHYMSGPHSGEWEKEVAASWQEPVLIDNHVAMVVNTHPHLAHKITGGTITPVHAKYLTIPLVPEAKGVPAREFSDSLFVIKTHGPASQGVLAKNVHTGSGKRAGFDVVPIYALVDSVEQYPWPGAMPPQMELQAIFDESFMLDFDLAIEGAAA